MENILQIAILVFSSASVWSFASKKHFKLGFIFGLCGQPFWIWSTFNGKLWGYVCCESLVYWKPY